MNCIFNVFLNKFIDPRKKECIPTIPSYSQALPAMFFICKYFSVWCYTQSRSSGCWQILIYVSPSDSTRFLHFLHYITDDWCWYCTDILEVLCPLSEVERGGLLRQSLCDRWGCLSSAPDITQNLGKKAADYLWWMKMVCTTVAVVASYGPSVINWMLRFALYKIYISL